MPEEKNVKNDIKKELNATIGKYIPNKVDLENLSNYLYKVVLNNLQDVDVKEEAKRVGNVNEFDRQGFLRAVHTLAVFSARDVMYKTLNDSFNSVKNQVDLLEKSSGAYASSNVYRQLNQVSTIPNMFVTPNDEGNFKIDLSDKNLAADPKAVEALVKSSEENSYQTRNIQNVKPARWSASDKEFDISDSLEDFNMGGTPIRQENFMSDASDLSGGTYSSVPSISKDLDY